MSELDRTESGLLVHRGSSAASAFRLRRLEAALAARGVEVSLAARHVHFVRLRAGAELTPQAQDVLSALLAYGAAPGTAAQPVALVVPRAGTVSPWSSKATEIARNCSLDAVERIERGVLWSADAPVDRALLAPLVHDRMTEQVLAPDADASVLFDAGAPRALGRVPVLAGGADALREADARLGLALSADEIDYLVDAFRQLERDATDVELMMFAQANSEHCRHKIFNASWVVDGEPAPRSLFSMIRNTHEQVNGRGILSAYADNASVLEGATAERFFPGDDGRYGYAREAVHLLMKVETHNHPTAIAPFPGAATGAGGEIRDEGAVGRGSKPKAGLTGFTTSHLSIPGDPQPWEGDDAAPARIASPLEIMLDGPIGAASFNNEFGRPALAGYFRTFDQRVELGDGAQRRGYLKPIMLAGGLGNVRGEHVRADPVPVGAPLVVLGGPAMLIGLGGGAASSMTTGTSDAELDFASVQRGNPEMQRRCQEVIDRCWALGEDNPIALIHDVGAGGLSNALPELVDDGGVGGRFDLRAIPSADSGLSPLELWCNESQERYVIALHPSRRDVFEALCARERCPFAVVGTATRDRLLQVDDPLLGEAPVSMPLDVLLGKPPKLERRFEREARRPPGLALDGVDPAEALERVLRFPAVASKSFLITIGDRSISGLVTRDQFVGPRQVPVADVAVTASGFLSASGEAMALGERTPLALVDSAAAARMAVGEALTNIAAADVEALAEVRLSANWMAAADAPGENQALFDAVHAVGMELCPALGIAIPVGKDSLSMRTVWTDEAGEQSVTAPVSLVVTAFAPVRDSAATLTPVLRDDGDETLLLVDLGGGRDRLGGSVLAQVYGQLGDEGPDLDDAAAFARAFEAVRALAGEGRIAALHDRSDGGLIVSLLEMAFAGGVGLLIDVPETADVLARLFSEELGFVIQPARGAVGEVRSRLEAAGLSVSRVARIDGARSIRVRQGDRTLFEGERPALHALWSRTSHLMQRLRDDPACADEEQARIEQDDAGLTASVGPAAFEDVAAPYVAVGARPRLAVLREQGVNGQVEMAAAFDLAGFDAVDVHMSDLATGRAELSAFSGVVACGGFSFGDVLGAGEGWAKSVRFDPRVAETFAAHFERSDAFTLGVCNGCQMLAALAPMIPGAEHWPRFVRNRSEQFEARLVQVSLPRSPSLFFDGLEGMRVPIAVAHGEGRASFSDAAAQDALEQANCVAMRYVEGDGSVATRYPANPNGSPAGIAGVCTPDGRVTALMPHPERVVRTRTLSWHPGDWPELSPWARMFRNARARLG